MNTERNWTSENRYNDSGPDAANAVPSSIVPAWSVPPGLMDPEAGTAPARPQAEGHGREEALDESDPAEPADKGAWPGVAQPARWFLRAPARPVPSPHREPD